MLLSSRILGADTVRALAERASSPVLVIGADSFRRSDLASVSCFNFIAAASLSVAMHALGVKDTRFVFEHVAPSELALPRIGAIAVAVLGAAFEAKGLGGEQPLETWVAKHRDASQRREFLTFHSIKKRETAREANEPRARRQRKERSHARRDTAQQLRVDRFLKRRGGGNAQGSVRSRQH